MNRSPRYRLVTRSDLDGLACAVLLEELGLIDGILFTHPKEMQDGKVAIGSRDIVTNLPWVPGCHLTFDHHGSEAIRTGGGQGEGHVLDPTADSAARVIYDYYGGASAFPRLSREMIDAVDKADSARFSMEEVLHPAGWTLLSFVMDARTGLGRFRDFRISNYQLMMDLIQHCRTKPVDEILALPDVAERVTLYFDHAEAAREQIRRCSVVHGNVVVLDLRDEDPIHPTNRFMVYALHPRCNVSIHVLWGLRRQNVALAIGASIFDRSCVTNVGELALRYGGGGHAVAGTCQVAAERADEVLAEVVARLREDDEAPHVEVTAVTEDGVGCSLD